MNLLQSDFEVGWSVIGFDSRGKNMVSHMLAYKLLCLEVTGFIFTHISLAKATYYYALLEHRGKDSTIIYLTWKHETRNICAKLMITN